MTPYYQDPLVTIYHGDCLELLPLEGVDLLVTDPPYGVDLNVGSRPEARPIHGDDAPFDPTHLLDLDLPTVLFGANNWTDKLPVSRGWLVWDKAQPEVSQHSQCELAWTNFVKGIRLYRQHFRGASRAPDGGWLHPAQKPVGLLQWVLNLHWTPPGVVLDPYMGAGSTLRAAKNLGRGAVGIEVDEAYCEVAAVRMQQEVLRFG